MINIYVLVFAGTVGEPIEVSAYDTLNDCEEVAYFLGQDLQPGASVSCEDATVPAVANDPLMFWPCPTEDSVNCYWDAQSQGNGRGRSYINVNGRIFYTGE